MKIHSLEINNFRGIRHEKFEPEGTSFVIHGPNGSGKSAVVDAIDFLLTGRISRLTGRGTGGITPSKYTPHIDSVDNPEEVWVKVKIEIPGVSGLVEISRIFDSPSQYQCDSVNRVQVDKIMDVAMRGQHVLSRRELLKYITAEKGQRGNEIQALLKLDEVVDTRSKLVTIANQYERKMESAQGILIREQNRLAEITGLSQFDSAQIIEHINNQRTLLQGNPITELQSILIKSDLTAPTMYDQSIVNVEFAKNHVESLKAKVSNLNHAELKAAYQELIETTSEMKSKENLQHLYELSELIETGISKLDDTGNCPLCGWQWEKDELRRQLEKKREDSLAIKVLQKKINDSSSKIQDIIHGLKGDLDQIIKDITKAGLSDKLTPLQSWMDKLSKLSVVLDSPVHSYSELLDGTSKLTEILESKGALESINECLHEITVKFPPPGPLQNGWDALTEIQSQTEDFEKALKELIAIKKARTIGQAIKSSYVEARNNVLDNLFTDVKDRFVELYRLIHGEDESNFNATLELNEADCDFKVDFHGRDMHPPHALHSEGHQDCMGLCLYLAIAEKLGANTLKIIVLDDVVMSIDTIHRRGVSDLLRDVFSDYQFLVTTHDKTWAHQLKFSLGLDKKHFKNFSGWTVESGPLVEDEDEPWTEIAQKIDANDIPSAAHKLRRWLEWFLDEVCVNLEAKTKHRQDGKNELGDLMSGAVSRYKGLIKKGKNAANSWNDGEAQDRLDELDSIRSQIQSRIGDEYWAINAAVHYNEWTKFTANDFRPVADAFEDFSNQFVCSQCKSFLKVTKDDSEEMDVRCNCSTNSWNLKKKTE